MLNKQTSRFWGPALGFSLLGGWGRVPPTSRKFIHSTTWKNSPPCRLPPLPNVYFPQRRLIPPSEQPIQSTSLQDKKEKKLNHTGNLLILDLNHLDHRHGIIHDPFPPEIFCPFTPMQPPAPPPTSPPLIIPEKLLLPMHRTADYICEQRGKNRLIIVKSLFPAR